MFMNDNSGLSSIVDIIERLAFRIERQSDQILLEQLGIGFSQYKIIHVLEANPQFKQKQIAKILGQTEASISRQIRLMRLSGLIVSVINPEHKREHITNLTIKGIKLRDAANNILAKLHTNIIGEMNDKKQRRIEETLMSLYVKI
jgi:DNA-binding MarR family transcriptional regulator